MDLQIEVLKKAKEIIGKPETWCKGRRAVDLNNKLTSHDDPDARAFVS